MSRPWEKQETDSVKWTKNHRFREHKMGRYRGFVWRPVRPRRWKSYCLMVQQKSAVFSPDIASSPDHSKHAFLLFPVGLYCFFTLRNGVVRRPIVWARRLQMEMPWRPRWPTITVVDIPSFYQAMSLTFWDIEFFSKHLVVFLLSIL